MPDYLSNTREDQSNLLRQEPARRIGGVGTNLRLDINPYHRAAPRLSLLFELEPAYRVFFRNLADILLGRSEPPIATTCKPGRFWSDVFVYSGAPWGSILESMVWHMIAVVAVLILSQAWGLHMQPQLRRTFRNSHITYYPASRSFPAARSSPPRFRGRSKKQSAAAPQPVWVRPERRRSLVTPPDIKLAAAAAPNLNTSNSAVPMVPLSATNRSLTVPAGPNSVVAPPPEVNQAGARQPALPAASVIGPAPEVEAVSARRGISTLSGAVVPPPPTVSGSMHKVGDVNIGHSAVIGPPPSLPMHEQSAIAGMARASLGSTPVVPPPPSVKRSGTLADGRVGALPAAGAQVVPPPPSVQGVGNSVAGGRVGALPGAGVQVVPPPPSVQGVGNSAAGGRVGALPGAGAQVVPPPPSVQGVGNSAAGRRVGVLPGAGAQVVPPPPSVQGVGNSAAGRGVGALLSAGVHVVPPPPPIQDVGNSAAGGRVGAVPGAGAQVVPPPPSVQGGNNPATGGPLVAMDVPPAVAPLPPMEPLTDNLGGPHAEELPLRLISVVLAPANTSYFSNFEVYIAERRLSKGKSQLIKLVYEFLPYQRRLSEYLVSSRKVYKLRVTRDSSCDETLMQMTWPQTDETHPESRPAGDPPALSPNDPNGMLPCYRTTADDYRRAFVPR